MKTKKQILKMSKEELYNYKWSDDLDLKKENADCSDCSRCFNCSDCSRCSCCSRCSICSNCSDCSRCSICSRCSNCSNCSDCRNAIGLRYAICNVELGKVDYEKKMEELSN